MRVCGVRDLVAARGWGYNEGGVMRARVRVWSGIWQRLGLRNGLKAGYLMKKRVLCFEGGRISSLLTRSSVPICVL